MDAPHFTLRKLCATVTAIALAAPLIVAFAAGPDEPPVIGFVAAPIVAALIGSLLGAWKEGLVLGLIWGGGCLVFLLLAQR